MREIKFRGKRLDNGEWVYGYYVAEHDEKHYIMHDASYSYWQVDPETVGQYSGYNDFFEGDIVEGFDELFLVKKGNVTIKKVAPDNSINEVEISCFYLECEGTPLFPIVNNYNGEHDLKGLKKVGNIWDNPDMLGDGEQ